MNTITRRSFLKTSAAATAVLGFPAIVRAQTSANEEIRVGVVGFHGRGGDHIKEFSNPNLKNVRIAALCDVDKTVLNGGVKRLSTDAAKVEGYSDLRKLYEDKSIDVISIATPNHWHSLAAIWGLQAGKHVYVQKPVSHNVSEGRRIIEAAQRYNRICQTGTQSRSNPGMRDAIAFLHSGKLGKITLARGLCYKPRKGIGKVDAPRPIPA